MEKKTKQKIDVRDADGSQCNPSFKRISPGTEVEQSSAVWTGSAEKLVLVT